MQHIPLSLYIHVPWCIKKCPYCDFNSHALKTTIPEMEYIQNLIFDLKEDLSLTANRPLHSIFIGGGTPSLLSAKAYEILLDSVFKLITPKDRIEITLEANPGTFEQQRFKDYRAVGINRLSIGCQSFNDKHLKALGRIHDTNQAAKAVEVARNAGFENFNLDLMFALPQQTLDEAMTDLQMAIQLDPTHLSWYQLTMEPNTLFHKYSPILPDEDTIADMVTSGKELLAAEGFLSYEVSAYAKEHYQCQHNLNYWRFGDYLGIGAGAHGKITEPETGEIFRTVKYKQPKKYLESEKPLFEKTLLAKKDLPFEFMLNALRLEEPIHLNLFQQRTGLDLSVIKTTLEKAREKGLIALTDEMFKPTVLGRQFLNNLVELFLP